MARSSLHLLLAHCARLLGTAQAEEEEAKRLQKKKTAAIDPEEDLGDILARGAAAQLPTNVRQLARRRSRVRSAT